MRILVIVLLGCFFAGMALAGPVPATGNGSVTRNQVPWLKNGRIIFNNRLVRSGYRTIKQDSDGISLFYIAAGPGARIRPHDRIGLVFDEVAGMERSVAIWRYKPWNSWTKPIPLARASQMPDEDVQFFYWRNKDGTYGAAVPLSGNGYRTTLGSVNGKWGSKSMCLADRRMTGEIPALAVGFDKDPFILFRKIYIIALAAMGRPEDQVENKTFPEPFNYIGWCTWNASEMGQKLNEEGVIAGVKTFTDAHFPLGWVLIDDGWFQQRHSQLSSLMPDSVKFPHGFKDMNDRLKNEFGIRYTGVWHALDGYWNGINPASGLGQTLHNELFSWKQVDGTWPDTTKTQKTYHFIRPSSDSLVTFYDRWYAYFKEQGFDFTKVDNQLVTERMALNNYPVFDLSEKMHQALYKASDKYFQGALINCMDMTAEAYFNFGHSAVARSVEDYFPYKKTEDYNLQHGNAAAHVLQSIYNSIYFSQMVYPDFDMFQSHNPHAVFHAIARAINCGPVYLTDVPGQQDFSILDPLVYRDGRIIHSQTALLPTEDCLFQVQGRKIFKAFSMVGNTGLLGIWNAADADQVTGSFRSSDVHRFDTHGSEGDTILTFEYFSKKWNVAAKGKVFPVRLQRMGYRLYYIIPVREGFAPIGLSGKYNAPATVLAKTITRDRVTVTLYEGGLFNAYASRKPREVRVNGQVIPGSKWDRGLLSVPVPDTDRKHPEVELVF